MSEKGSGIFGAIVQQVEQAVKAASVKTDFDGKTHQEMESMIAHADPSKMSGLAKKLTDAAVEIEKVGNDLKDHIGLVPWDGEAGDAFREWGNSLANSTLRLGNFSKNAGK